MQPSHIEEEFRSTGSVGSGRAADAPGSEPKLSVCHIINSLRYGGAERQFVNTLIHLPDVRKTAIILDANPAVGQLDKLLPDNVPVFGLGVRLRHLPQCVWKLSRLLKKLKVDVVHTHMYWASLYGVPAARIAQVPVVVTSEHGRNPWKSAGQRWVERAVISRWSDMRVCVSEDILQIRRDVDGIPADKLIYVPNGTGIPDPVKHTDSRPVVIGTVGRFVKEKDYITLVRAAAHLRDMNRDFQLYLVGDGPLRPSIAQEIADLNLQTIVQLPGLQHDVSNWLRRFDVFVMSSIREGQPVALLEAMAHGLPVVATRVGGIPDTVNQDREGILVDPSDPVALANALAELVDDPGRRRELGTHARQRVIQDFSIDISCERYLNLYQRLLNRSGHGAV
jgi:glycosyltransferase involved in cell wall biosynthesis